MELWIRSQDKEILAKANILSLAFNNKDETCEIINSFEDHQCWELGTYKSKERALEVLDEIQNILNLKDMYKYDRELVLKSWENMDAEQVKTARQQMSLYEMPKE